MQKDLIKFITACAVITVFIAVYNSDLATRVAEAVSGDYTKTGPAGPNPTLNYTDWNNLPNDFLDKEDPAGDQMNGNLDMAGHAVVNLAHPPVNNYDAATKQYVDENIGAGAVVVDQNGAAQRMVCDTTGAGATIWVDDGANQIYTDVNTTNSGLPNFTSVPRYITSLGGSNNHFSARGPSAILMPTVSGFRIRLTTSFTASYANSNLWHVNWCGIGN